jgi:hypothetical protein
MVLHLTLGSDLRTLAASRCLSLTCKWLYRLAPKGNWYRVVRDPHCFSHGSKSLQQLACAECFSKREKYILVASIFGNASRKLTAKYLKRPYLYFEDEVLKQRCLS